MCLGIPGRVVETYDEHDVRMGRVDFGGVRRPVCLEHVPDTQPGHYVIVHVGFALSMIERDRARTYFQAYAAAMALHFVEKAMEEVHAGRTQTWADFEVPDDGIGCGFHEAVRGVLSHHLVIRDGKIANYHPYPPTPGATA